MMRATPKDNEKKMPTDYTDYTDWQIGMMGFWGIGGMGNCLSDIF
jgi:hypothetical protein